MSNNEATKTADLTQKGIEFLPNDFNLVGEDRSIETDMVYGKSTSYWKDAVGRFVKNKGAVVSLICIIFIVFMAAVGPYMNGYGYDETNMSHSNLPPRIPGIERLGILDGSESKKLSNGTVLKKNPYISEDGKETGLEDTYYWFGTDVLGRDIFTRVWMGTRISLYIALAAVIIDMFIGLSYGMISGYFGGAVDTVMQRFAEIINGIPSLVVVTLLIIVLRPGLQTITLALAITGWIGMSRIARAQVLKLKEQEYVMASRTLGAGNFRLIFKEMLPNMFGPVITNTMFSIPNAIFTEAFLAFIGLGVPVPMASLGSLISDAFKNFTTHPYMIAFPVIVLVLLMLSFNILADGLRDALDPQMQER